MNKIGKNFSCYGMRWQLIGDILGGLTILNHLERLYPSCYKTVGLAGKAKHFAPLLINHPLIDRIHIQSGFEGPEGDDWNFINSHDIVINGNPSHPLQYDWPNYRNFYAESFIMGGFSEKDYADLPEDQKLPKLVKWFRPESRPLQYKKIISIWGFAGYSVQPYRSPTANYWRELVKKLIDLGYGVCQFGHFNDPVIMENNVAFHRFNERDFFEQIRMTLSTDLVLSTDSGSGLIFAAYDFNQINIVNMHVDGHVRNPFSLAPLGPNTFNFCGETCCDDVPQDQVIAKILEKTK
jgi:ADP-heptose:LPS heptosyltransferase